MRKILGIDEAGRGPVIGPMIIAGVLINENKIEKLKEIGARDSKELNRNEREELFEEIKKIVDEIYIEFVSVEEINEWMERGLSITDLELKKIIKIILKANPDVVMIDCPTIGKNKFLEKLMKYVKADLNIIAEHKADKKYPVVSAASIVAKVIRDREIDKIKEKVGIDFGSGYPSDERTIRALKENYSKLKKYVRKKWKTVLNISQRNLLEFFSINT